MPSVVGVIPARYGSSRLPGKALVELQGKPLLYYVYHRSCRARSLHRVLIATDDERIRKVATAFGAEVVMTKKEHRSGTDRIAEAIQDQNADIIINIQGDEPLIDYRQIDQTVTLLQEDESADIATLKTPISSVEELMDPNLVKVVTDENGYALYFSRAPIPYNRSNPRSFEHCFIHVGLYAYRRDFLMKFTQWGPSKLEKLEALEQLRALEHGARIKVGLTNDHIFGVDTPQDLERIRKLVEGNQKLLEA
jgi:3-deoxy-manno-octulosonate cytidylyltransferase (CMP-KDO synthetase)